MILEDDTPLYVHNRKKIRRKHSGVLVSEPVREEYKVFKMRQLMYNIVSYPSGYM